MSAVSELAQYFKELEAQDKFSGVVLITQSHSQLFAGAYGYASRAWKIRNTLDMRFDTASITKLFTAVATLQLIDQDLLAFDTGVIDFLELEGTAISKDVNVGVSALIRHFPKQDISVVILSNMEEGVWEPVWKVHDLLVAG